MNDSDSYSIQKFETSSIHASKHCNISMQKLVLKDFYRSNCF